MRTVIVHNSLRDLLYQRIDAALAGLPKDAQAGREELYRQLLTYYDEHGRVPEFTIEHCEEAKE